MAFVLAGLALVAILIVRLLLPWLVGAGLAGVGIWFWHRHQTQRRALHLLFYEQLEARQGRISVLEFAMASGLTGSEARAFLDARAREFFANFEPTDAGDVLYTFPASKYAAASTAAPSAAVGSDFNSISPLSEPILAAAQRQDALHLTEAELALRLGCCESEIAEQRHRPEFDRWSRQKDPDSFGWAYNAGCDRYSPIPKDL
jgi:hypothetical protein